MLIHHSLAADCQHARNATKYWPMQNQKITTHRTQDYGTLMADPAWCVTKRKQHASTLIISVTTNSTLIIAVVVSDRLCTATQTQNPSVFRFKIPCGSTVIHTRPCHLHHRNSQSCHKYGGFETPPGPATNCMVFASPECVEKTC